MDLMDKIKRPVVEGVHLALPNGEEYDGMLCVTAFHFIFSTRIKAEDETMFLHTSILSIDHQNPSTNTSINIILKDFRKFSIDFPTIEECVDIVESLELLSNPNHLEKLHPFFSRPRGQENESNRFSPEDMATLFKRYNCSEDRWRISSCNKNYKLCSLHPQEVIVPAKITDNDIATVSTFRQHGRFPILCYHHYKNKAVILRCGEPLCGPTQKRCREDIALLNASLLMGKGRIIDVRTQQAAQYSMSKGGGVEYPSYYSQWRVEYASLESLSSLQASYTKLVEACTDPSLATSSSWFGRLDSSGWLTHIEQLLRAVKHVVHLVHQESSNVVVHGSSGRDSTLQVTSLAILLMDPYSRTLRGFLQLIEREWLLGGHPFSLRHGHVKSVPEKQKGPVFLIFLDALWQIMRQYPLSFEFNELLLHLLFIHSYSSSYGTFLYDTPAERDKYKLSERTESLWDYILSPSVCKSLLNPLYIKNNNTLIISTHPCSIYFWNKLYVRSDLSPSLAIQGYEKLVELKSKNQTLKQRLKQVREEIEALQLEARKYPSIQSHMCK